MPKAKILLVDDEEGIVEGLKEYLDEKGFDVETANNGLAALEVVKSYDPDLMLLDVRMPEIDGFEVCRRVRMIDNTIGIIFMTALDTDVHKVRGLDIGADDYITKPFSTIEVEARINAMLRRKKRSQRGGIRSFSDVRIDSFGRKVTRGEEVIPLTQKEFDLLLYFVDNPEEVLGRGRLLEEVWGHDRYPTTRTVDIHILQLRKKLEPVPSKPRYFQTVHGIGYKFVP